MVGNDPELEMSFIYRLVTNGSFLASNAESNLALARAAEASVADLSRAAAELAETVARYRA